MLRLILAGIAFVLMTLNKNNLPLGFYWLLVAIYWATNYYNGRVNR